MQELEVLSSFVINLRAADPRAIASTSSAHELGSRGFAPKSLNSLTH